MGQLCLYCLYAYFRAISLFLFILTFLSLGFEIGDIVEMLGLFTETAVRDVWTRASSVLKYVV